MPRAFGKTAKRSGPRRNRQTLVATRFAQKERKYATRRFRKEALRTQKLSKQQAAQLYYSFNETARSLGLHPAESHEIGIDDIWTVDDIEKITEKMAEHTSKPDAVKKVIRSDLNATKRLVHTPKTSTLKILLLFMLTWLPAADAKWYDVRVPYSQFSLWDRLGILTMIVDWSATYIPTLKSVAEGTSILGEDLAQLGFTQRAYNIFTGDVPYSPGEILSTALTGVEAYGAEPYVSYAKGVRIAKNYAYPLLRTRQNASVRDVRPSSHSSPSSPLK